MPAKYTCGDCTFFRPDSLDGCQFPGNFTGGDSIACIQFKPKTSAEIRKFETGATRDTNSGKLNYVGALSPIVLQRYVQYLDAHRKQPDGSLRDFDNWKKGIPIEVYFEGLGRHFVATWLLAQGFSAEDNHGPVTLEDSLCASIFNASGWLHEILKAKLPKKSEG
uniref:dATP/dGTP diphosphohydrolase N-terminal domain-containing protein n=1 Tax=viral metagenome TaxID=1070528 RepID=A0A6M3JAZ4_9ZZZZ